MANPTSTYKIRQVIDLTGASEFLLRIWENRYSAFKPRRTKSGRRLYTESDVMKARALLALTQQGHRVGDIAHLNLSQLNELLAQSAANPSDHCNQTAAMRVHPVVYKIMRLASDYQWLEVRRHMLNEKRKIKTLDWIESLLLPLLTELSRGVDERAISIDQEHILTAMIKECLAHRMELKTPLKNSPRIVLATPEGDFHDLGILIASTVCSELRVNSLLLGPHMPKSDLAAVCVRFKATHLLLSSTTSRSEGANDEFLKYLHFLDQNLDPRVTVWLAGRNASKYNLNLQRPFQIIHSFDMFHSEVKKCLKSC